MDDKIEDNAGYCSMRLRNGIELLDEREGVGRPAGKGDRIVYNFKIFLNKGDTKFF